MKAKIPSSSKGTSKKQPKRALPRGNAAQARQSARKVVRTVNRYATANEGVGVVKRVSAAGNQTKFVNASVRQVRKELGGKAAKQYRQTLYRLDGTTQPNTAHRKSARKAAKRTAKRIAK